VSSLALALLLAAFPCFAGGAKSKAEQTGEEPGSYRDPGVPSDFEARGGNRSPGPDRPTIKYHRNENGSLTIIPKDIVEDNNPSLDHDKAPTLSK
jgi:hypothetical protein